MKVSNKQYAHSLFEATKDSKSDKLKVELENFVKLLAENNDVNRLNAIMTEFDQVWQKETGVVEATVHSADRLEKETLEEMKTYIQKQTGSENIVLEHHVDQKLLAGFILRFGDQVIDGSAKAMIKTLGKQLIK